MKVKTEEYPELQQWPWYIDYILLKCKRNRAEEILSHPQYLEGEAECGGCLRRQGICEEEVKLAIQERRGIIERQEKEEKVIRGILSIPNIPHITKTF